MVLLKDLIDDAEAKYGYTSPKRPMSGFYWVSKVKSCTKKGYIFQYTFRKNKEQIRFARVDLRELKWEAKLGIEDMCKDSYSFVQNNKVGGSL